MKNNPLTGILMALLFLSTAATVWRMIEFETAFHKLQNLEPQRREVVMMESVFNSLLNDVREYENTTKNPDMMRILQGLDSSGKTAAAPATKPAK